MSTEETRVDPAVLTEQEEDEALADAPWRRFVVLGDSIAEAKLADPYEGLERIGWPERVARALRRQQPDLEFHNLGRRDLTSAEVRASQLDEAVRLAPDITAVICGGNDVLARDFDRTASRAELEAIVGGLRDSGADVVLLTTFDIAGSLGLPAPLERRIGERMWQLAEEVRATTEAHDAVLVNLFVHARGKDPGIFSADHIHANELGHAIVATEVVSALGRRLAELA